MGRWVGEAGAVGIEVSSPTQLSGSLCGSCRPEESLRAQEKKPTGTQTPGTREPFTSVGSKVPHIWTH